MNARFTPGTLLRAVVVKTYLPGDADHPFNRTKAANYGDPADFPEIVARDVNKVRGVCCDLIIYGAHYRNRLFSVAVMQPGGGMGDQRDMWIPRAATMKIGGDPLRLGVTDNADEYASRDVTRPEDMDGDHVIVAFLENDSLMPIIVGSLTHPHTEEPFTAHRSTFRHRGVSRVVDEDGSTLVDLTGASSGTLDEQGVEQPNAGGNGSIVVNARSDQTVTINIGGTMRLLLEDGTVTLDAAEIKLGATASEALVKGDAFKTLFNGHTHAYAPGPGAPVPTATPLPLMDVVPNTHTSSKVKTD